MKIPTHPVRRVCALATLVLLTAACGGVDEDAPSSSSSTTSAGSASTTGVPSAGNDQGVQRHFKAEIWADNWFSLYLNGELVGEDSVPITTERSFNSETFTFDVSYPFMIAMVTKDFKENDSGLEYIGTGRQQMGDGGFIAQITDTSTGTVVAKTGSDWRGLVIHRAPLDTACEKSANPMAECAFESSPEPANWAAVSFDDSTWVDATIYTAQEVGPKDGYLSIKWDPSAALIWTSSLKQDNTILWRHVVTGP